MTHGPINIRVQLYFYSESVPSVARYGVIFIFTLDVKMRELCNFDAGDYYTANKRACGPQPASYPNDTKRPESLIDHSPLSSAFITNPWSYIPSLLYVFYG